MFDWFIIKTPSAVMLFYKWDCVAWLRRKCLEIVQSKGVVIREVERRLAVGIVSFNR